MDWRLWRRWTVSTTVGELAGFTAPAVAGAVTTASPVDSGPRYALLLAAGFVEGLALGAAQGWALGPVLPRLSRPRFALATGAAAVVAYAVGALPSTLGDRLAALPRGLLVGGAAVGGLVLLGSIGTTQWLVLRRGRYGGPWWIATTAGAWLAGLLALLAVSTPLWRPGQPVWLVVAIGLLGGAVMAVTVAMLTGLAAVRLRPAGRAPYRRGAADRHRTARGETG